MIKTTTDVFTGVEVSILMHDLVVLMNHLKYAIHNMSICVMQCHQKVQNMICYSSSGSSSIGMLNVLQIPPGEAQVNDIALNHNGRILYTAASDRVRVWDIRRYVMSIKLHI